MKVLLLGAGASKAACYPLAAELIPKIEAEATATNFVNLRDAWKEWETFRNEDSASSLKRLINNPNPEVIFSLLDLYKVGRDAERKWALARARTRAQNFSMEDAVREYEEYLDAPKGAALSRGDAARESLLACLREFFSSKHYRDSLPENRSRRDYLRNLLSRLGVGDVVVTLNWDTTVERTLSELSRWNPKTGYGFEHALKIVRANSPEPDPPSLGILQSEVHVLKLHGSFGWYRDLQGQLYFEQVEFLNYFEFQDNGEPIQFIDPKQGPLGPPENPVLLYPSFLKQFQGPEMQLVWYRAQEALRQAQYIDIHGYSLPESDTAVRALLNVLRFHLERAEVEVQVHDPDPEAQDRWQKFLGPSAKIDGEKLG